MIARAAERLITLAPYEAWTGPRVCRGLVRAFAMLPYIAIYSPVRGRLRVVNVAGTRTARESIVAHWLLEAAARYLGRGTPEHIACLKWARMKAHGCHNDEVAAELHMSEVTLKRHRARWCDLIAVGINIDNLFTQFLLDNDPI